MDPAYEKIRLKQMVEELQSIVYVSSHDLRSPLVNVEGFSGSLSSNCTKLRKLLANENISEENKEQVFTLLEEIIPEDLLFINEGTKKMKSLIDGLLQVSRVGTVEVVMEDLNMDSIIANIVANVAFKAQEIGATIIIQDDLPVCFGDPKQINQLFSNLIDNGIKYLDPERKGEIHISGQTENGKSCYSVKDNGIGVPEGQQERIFEVYHRLDPGDNAGGEGLGLTIIRRILNRHDGSIRLESEPGIGSEFFVTLPNC